MDERMFIEEKDLKKRKIMMEEWIIQNSSVRPTIDEIDHIIDCFETIYKLVREGMESRKFYNGCSKE